TRGAISRAIKMMQVSINVFRRAEPSHGIRRLNGACRDPSNLRTDNCLSPPRTWTICKTGIQESPRRRIHAPRAITGESCSLLLRIAHEAQVGDETAQVLLGLVEKPVVRPAKTGFVAPVATDPLGRATRLTVAPEFAALASAVLLRDERENLIADASESPCVAVELL